MRELTKVFEMPVLITLTPHQKTEKYHKHNCVRKILESKGTFKKPVTHGPENVIKILGCEETCQLQIPNI